MTKLSRGMRGFAIAVVSVFAFSAWGGSNNCTPGTAGCSNTSSGGTQGTEGGGNEAPGGGANINQGANEGSDSQNTGMMINLAAGATFTGICATKYGSWACPLAAMSFLQAAHDMAAADDSDQVANMTDTYEGLGGTGEIPGGGNYNGNPYNPEPGTGGGGSETTFANPNTELNKLAKMGYKVNPKKGTVTTPNGEIPMSAFNSASDMAEAGYDESSIAAAQSAIKKVNADALAKYGDKAKVVAMGVSSRGGGGGGYGEADDGAFDGGDPMAAYLASLKNKMRKNRGPASVAGMKRMAGGEPIGVAMDNIFEMVHRRYQKKRRANIFIEMDVPKSKKGYNF